MERLFGIDEILVYIEEKKKQCASSTHQLSMYYEATQKDLEPSEKSLLLWREYISLLEKHGYTETEIREVYKMLRMKYYKFLGFWKKWVEYERSVGGEGLCSRMSKLVENIRDILRYKSCTEKAAILAFALDVEEGIGRVEVESVRMEAAEHHVDENRFLNLDGPLCRVSRDERQDMGKLGLTSNILDLEIGADGADLGVGDSNEMHVYGETNSAAKSLFGSGQGGPGQKRIQRGHHSEQNRGREKGEEETFEYMSQGRAEKGETSDESRDRERKTITMNGKRMKILRTIGRGGSSKVYQVMGEKNEVFALKKVKIRSGERDEEMFKNYANEIDLLKRMGGRKEIISLKDSYVNRECIAILMEYGEVDLGRFLEEERGRMGGGYRRGETYMVRNIWEQMLRAVKCIHEFRIVHRDLKPANFLFVGGRLKLIDFGISKEIRNDTTNIIREKQIGTINYMSPEALKEGKTKMGRSSDIWSLGCILYEMYFGAPPFMRFKNIVQRMQKLLDPEYRVEYFEWEEGDTAYGLVVDEMKKCLVKDVKGRGKIEELLEGRLLLGPDERESMSFTRRGLAEFVERVMDLRHGARGEGKRKVAEKIVEMCFSNAMHT
jgi:serine/threonine-protein kinase TTK/MPS1